MINLIIFGPPGSGKGTQAAMLKDHFNLLHISTGDLLRKEIAEGTTLGMEAKKFMDEGKLVPDAVVTGMLSNTVDDARQNNKAGIIFDGFPRTVAQAEALDNLLAEKNTSVRCVLSLVVDEEEVTKRILERGKASGRTDDQDAETVKKRVQEYRTKTEPVSNYYARFGLVKEVNGIGSIDAIFHTLKNIVETVD